MIEITGIFKLKNGDRVVSGESPWDNEVQLNVNDVLVCGSKQWKIIAIDRIYQGCFGAPTFRQHALKLNPIGHNDMPNEKDILVRP